MSQVQIDKHHCEECAELVEYFGEEDYTDYPQWTDFILKWNKAQDVMGIKQTLWVLRLDFGWKKSLTCLHPDRYNKLLNLLREKYHELVKRGKLEPQKD